MLGLGLQMFGGNRVPTTPGSKTNQPLNESVTSRRWKYTGPSGSMSADNGGTISRGIRSFAVPNNRFKNLGIGGSDLFSGWVATATLDMAISQETVDVPSGVGYACKLTCATSGLGPLISTNNSGISITPNSHPQIKLQAKADNSSISLSFLVKILHGDGIANKYLNATGTAWQAGATYYSFPAASVPESWGEVVLTLPTIPSGYVAITQLSIRMTGGTPAQESIRISQVVGGLPVEIATNDSASVVGAEVFTSPIEVVTGDKLQVRGTSPTVIDLTSYTLISAAGWEGDTFEISTGAVSGLPSNDILFYAVFPGMVDTIGVSSILYQSGDASTWQTTAVWGFERNATTIALDTNLGGGKFFSGEAVIYRTWEQWICLDTADGYLYIGRLGIAGYSQRTAKTQGMVRVLDLPYLARTIEEGATLGDELITVSADRDFSADTGFWTLQSGWSIDSGLISSGVVGSATYRGFLTAGTFYQITTNITNYVSGILHAKPGYNVWPVPISGNGEKVIYATADEGWFYITSSDPGFVAKIASISVKPVLPAITYGVFPGMPKMVFWGDSLTWYGYPSIVGKLIGNTPYILNKGITNETSTQIKDRLLAATDDIRSRITIIWAGTNNFDQSATILADIATMVAALSTSKYLVLSLLTNTQAFIGSENYNKILTHNSALSSAYGDRYLDVRQQLVESYDPNISQDVIAHNNDTCPPSLMMADTIHPNGFGSTVVATAVYDKLIRLGYI